MAYTAAPGGNEAYGDPDGLIAYTQAKKVAAAHTNGKGYEFPTGTKALWRNGGPDLPITITGIMGETNGTRHYSTEEYSGGTPENEIVLDPYAQLELLAEWGAKFALPAGRTKGTDANGNPTFPKGWQNKPHDLKQAIAHARKKENVGILTGEHSDKIIALDRDVKFPQTIAMLGPLGQTAKIIRDNAPERGKFLYRIKGPLPPTTSWKEKPEDKHPAVECLAKGRHALGPTSEIEGGHYLLIDAHYGIKEVTIQEFEAIWRLITGESLDKSSRRKDEATGKKESDEYIAKVRAAWPTLEIFKHHGMTTNGTEPERGKQTRLLGNGGLIVAENGQWYCHSDGLGGAEFEAWCYGKNKRAIRDKEFYPIVDEMAALKGIPKPEIHTNGNGKKASTEETDQADTDDAAPATDEQIEEATKKVLEAKKGDRLDPETTEALFKLLATVKDAFRRHTYRTTIPKQLGIKKGEYDGFLDEARKAHAPQVDTRPLSVRIESDLQEWGYRFWLNIMDDSLWNGKERMDDPKRAILKMRARDNGYGGQNNPKNLQALEDACLMVAAKNACHPVRDWLNGLQWDGQDHIAHLSYHFLEKLDGNEKYPTITYADSTTRTRFHAFLMRWMIGAVAKQMGDENAIRNNFVLVLAGEQGGGKSHFASWICPLRDYFVEKHISPENKDCTLLRTRTFVWEIMELGATTKKADVEALKGFITGTITTERKAYGHFDTVKPSVASYIGTLNPDGAGFLSDGTGNRRFCVIDIEMIAWDYANKIDPAQLWAQAVALWKADPRSYRLTDEEVEARNASTEAHMAPDIFADMLGRVFEIDPTKAGEKGWRVLASEILVHLRTYGGLSNGSEIAQGREIAKALKTHWGITSKPYGGSTCYRGLRLRSQVAKVDAVLDGMEIS